MKKLLTLCPVLCLLLACAGQRSEMRIVVSNSLEMRRSGEMVEVDKASIYKRLALADTATVVISDADGTEIPYQSTYNGLLIFPATVEGSSSATYTIRPSIPADVPMTACGRQYPERMDDMAWENDLASFRAYGPTLQARGERGFGYDLFTKRGTPRPVLEKMYADEVNPDKWKRIAELRKSAPQAADELLRANSYHVDHGYGMDCYAVGPTLGGGVAALMAGDSIVYPWCYKEYEILDNGPLRFTVRLRFTPLTVAGDTAVIETRLITLDAGSHLNRTLISYDGLSRPAGIAAGCVLHEPQEVAAVTTHTEAGYMSYIDPTTGSDNGKIFLGLAFPNGVERMETRFFPTEEKKQRNNADGHLLAISRYNPGDEFLYYWGFGWDRADMADIDAWNEYLRTFVQKLKHPLEVKQ